MNYWFGPCESNRINGLVCIYRNFTGLATHNQGVPNHMTFNLIWKKVDWSNNFFIFRISNWNVWTRMNSNIDSIQVGVDRINNLVLIIFEEKRIVNLFSLANLFSISKKKNCAYCEKLRLIWYCKTLNSS